MKIIKPGKIKEKLNGRKTCHFCNCIFEYDSNDVKYNLWDCGGIIKGVKCPTAGCQVILPVSL
jgi:hypothetical protein